MLKIRLQRVGRRNNPSFRIVVIESQEGPKSGKALEVIGFHNPKTKERKIDGERAKHWMKNGAQPSDTVHNILVTEGVLEGKKKNVLPKKSPVVKEKTENGEQKAESGSESAEGGEKEEAKTPTDDASAEKPAETEDTQAVEEKPTEENKEADTANAVPAAEKEKPAEKKAAA